MLRLTLRNACLLCFFAMTFLAMNPPRDASMRRAVPRRLAGLWGRIALFALFYLLLAAAGVAAVALSVWLTLTLAGGWAGAGAWGVALSVPLMAMVWSVTVLWCVWLTRHLLPVNPRGVERLRPLERHEAPRLFALVEEVAAVSGCEPPGRLYLSAEANARMIFSISLRTVFFPARKEMEIGLGLMRGMSVAEFRAILAHEFGHFSQGVTRTYSICYMALEMLRNFNAGDSELMRTLPREGARWWFTRAGAEVVLKFGRAVRAMSRPFYGMVLRSRHNLSLTLEFEADRHACALCGTDVFISSLCKAERLAHGADTDALHPDRLLLTPLELPPSRLTLYTPGSAHPPVKARIEAARSASPGGEAPQPQGEAIDLVPEAVAAAFPAAATPERRESAGDDADSFFGSFFLRRLTLPGCTPAPSQDSPFTQANALTLRRWRAAEADRVLLTHITAGRVEARVLSYDGLDYPSPRTALKLHEDYMRSLRPAVEAIDAAVEAYMRQHHPSRFPALLAGAAEAQELLELHTRLEPLRDALVHSWNPFRSPTALPGERYLRLLEAFAVSLRSLAARRPGLPAPPELPERPGAADVRSQVDAFDALGPLLRRADSEAKRQLVALCSLVDTPL